MTMRPSPPPSPRISESDSARGANKHQQDADRGAPVTLSAPISPPRRARRKPSPPPEDQRAAEARERARAAGVEDAVGGRDEEGEGAEEPEGGAGDLAAIEAGDVAIRDHLAHFTRALGARRVPAAQLSPLPSGQLLLPLGEFAALYRRNRNARGRHFVVHQHDHPVAGTHYDLRLQFSETSSLSWAVMYGLPGNVGSVRRNRNATETRVHNVWSHLVETASHPTGSMLIWDTGEYEVLPRHSKHAPEADPDSASSDSESAADAAEALPENEKLVAAFRRGKIRLRLHGTRLPKNYTLRMWAAHDSKHAEQPQKPVRKRKRRDPAVVKRDELGETASESEGGDAAAAVALANTTEASERALQEELLREAEDGEVRRTNAYPGATNSVGSVHQRQWFLAMDAEGSGFYRARKNPVLWERRGGKGGLEGFEPFFVRGVEGERSVVTGRTAADVMKDEGVVGYVRRKGWRAILE